MLKFSSELFTLSYGYLSHGFLKNLDLLVIVGGIKTPNVITDTNMEGGEKEKKPQSLIYKITDIFKEQNFLNHINTER